MKHVNPNELEYLTIDEAAELLGVPARMIENEECTRANVQALEAFDYRLGASRADMLRAQHANGW